MRGRENVVLICSEAHGWDVDDDSAGNAKVDSAPEAEDPTLRL